MDFTETQLDILYRAKILACTGSGQVLEDWATTDALELAEQGWLEQRVEANGDRSWWWTPEAETALDLSGLLRSADGREN